MPLAHRPRWVYTDGIGAGDFTMALPMRPHTPGSRGLGGSDVSAAGVPAAFEIRRDPLLHMTLRFYEWEWPDVERVVRHLQRAGSVILHDAFTGSPLTVYGESPAITEEILPRRADAGTLELDITVRRTTTVVIPATYFDDAFFRFSAAAPGVYAYTRSSTATAVGKDGLIYTAGVDELRTDYVLRNGVRVPTTLLEPAYTNLVTEDDLTAWTALGTPIVTPNADGTYTVEDDDGTSSEFVERTITFTFDGVKAVVFVVRENTMASAGAQSLQLTDVTSDLTRINLNITGWVDGEPTIAPTVGTYLGKRPIGDGRWAIYASASVTAASSNRLRVYPASSGTATGSIDIYRVNAYNAAIPPTSILDASDVLAAGKLTRPPGFTMEAIRRAGAGTFYQRWIERGTAYDTTAATRYWQVGDQVRLLLFSGSSGDGTIDGSLFETGGVNATSSPSAVVPIGSPAEARLVVYLDPADDLWKVQCGVSVDGAAEVLGSVATFGATLPDFDVDLLMFGSSYNADVQEPVALEEVKGVPGNRSLAGVRTA